MTMISLGKTSDMECGRLTDETDQREPRLKVHTKEYEMLDGTRKKLVERVGDGSIITRFDKTPVPRGPNDVVCPHFLELKWATGCPYSCAWCYLQGTFRFQDYGKKPRPKDFCRVEQHLQAFFDGDGIRPEILNSGELSDSMITERRSRPFSKFVTELFDTQTAHKVLFVTKSPEVGNLLEAGNPKRAIASFSVNAEKVARRWEKAPCVKERVEAASLLEDAGFKVRLRIDPMVPVEGWQESYSALLEEIFSKLTPERITIGSLRGLQSTINNSKDKSWTDYLDERSNWGKKIGAPTRKEMYTLLVANLRESYGFRKVAFCKETVQMWKDMGMDYRKIRCNCIQ